MKNIINSLIFLTLLSACGSSSDLETLKADKVKLQNQLNKLKTEIISIDTEIAKLDNTSTDDKLELVTVIELEKTDFKHYIEAQGKTYSEDNVMVTTDMGGLVKAVYVDEGQYVNKGQTVIQLDNSIVMNQLAELETGIALAQEVYEKRKRLWDQNIGSEIEYLQAQNNYNSLVDKKATIQTQLSKSSIKAPISGYVEMINLKLGEMASPGMPACQLVNNKNMEIRVDLPENYLGKAKKGNEILVEIPALGLEKTAKIKSIGQTVNSYNRSFQIIATIDNSKNELKPNMLAKVKLTDEAIKDAIVLPTNLLQEASNGYFVYIANLDTVKNHYLAHKQHIEVGDSYGGNIVVTSGIEAGDIVIDKGFRNVLEGQIIKIQE